VIVPPLLNGRDRYERVTHGWTDNAHDDVLTHTVTITDPDRAVEVVVLALPSPTYEIRQARCRSLAGGLEPGAVEGFSALAGVAMVGGLTRRVAEVVGGAGAGLVVDATVEVARLARQVTRLPRERAERAVASGARACWELDRAGWVDLPDSCFTYSAEGGARFAGRTVTTPIQPDLYSPRPGQRKVFERRKVARLAREGSRLTLAHSMHDNLHGFELTYEIDLAGGAITRAESLTPKLPYAGICSEPQARIASLVGEPVDAELPRRLQTLLGGASGCAQLYELTADLLKLLGVGRRR
jgi:hypothetical protein